MNHAVHSILIIVLLSFSCSTNREGQIYQSFDQEDIQVGTIEDSLMTVELAYVGAIGHSYIFECYIENKSENSLILDKSQFKMILPGGKQVNSSDENQIVQGLKEDRKGLKKRKKNMTILGGIYIGLGTILGAAEGLNPVENLAYNAEPIFGIFDERRWYQRNIDSVEDEIEYVRSAQFNTDRLTKGQSIIRDVLFPTHVIKDDIDVVFAYGENEYSFTFPRQVFR